MTFLLGTMCVFFLKCVKVGRGAVIGSGSVVLSDVESMAVYAGVPARKIKKLSQSDCL